MILALHTQPGAIARRCCIWSPPTVAVCAAALLTGCSGRQSSLEPAGAQAEQISKLFWWMTGGAVVIWIAVLVLAFVAIRFQPARGENAGGWLIVVGGAVIPTVILTGLLAYGLSLLPGLVAPPPAGSLKISVAGEQWWWRVRYPERGGRTVELANEIRIPVNEPVEFELSSSNVIHAFWVPSLAGKRDMIPGRVTRLTITPTRTGSFRGVCAEYCGASHALMAFEVVVMERDEFDRWWDGQARDATEPTTELAVRGRALFEGNGCGACHSIRGTSADGVIGPDLTHVGSRLTIAAGILTNSIETTQRWISHPNQIKPGALMLAFHMLPEAQIDALAHYLQGLK